jgi:hypothetical protein
MERNETRTMSNTDHRPRRPRPYVLALAVIFSSLASGAARAQVFVGVTPYGPYFGWGDTQAEQLNSYLAQQGVIRSQAAQAQRNQMMGSVDNSNAYYNHLRDPTYLGRSDATSRRPVEDEAARRYSDAARTGGSGAGEKRVAPPVRPLADYFDRSHVLVWPGDAPTDDDLSAKRGVSNAASLAVLVETQRTGVARLATVTTARTKLLEYGRPALDLLRRRTTPAASDLFHAFLLGLYDSLADAATPPPTPAPAPRS